MDCSERNRPSRNRLTRIDSLVGVIRGLFVCLVVALGAFTDYVAAAEAKDAGLMFKSRDGEPLRAPTLMTEVDIAVTGIIARVRVRQKFYNPTDAWQEGIYVFPLPEQSAVDHMRMKIGVRIVEGQIKEREAARATYESAKQEGRKAALIEQERPNIFTNNVAHIGPNEEVEVQIEYQQKVQSDQGTFRLRFPMVVGSRYIPGTPGETVATGTGWAPDTNAVPDASRITPPVVDRARGDSNPVTIRVDLNAGAALASVGSPYHKINAVKNGDTGYRVSLADGPVPANKDFELVWTPAVERAAKTVVFTETFAGADYALLMVMPPAAQQAAARHIARDAIFIIDTSGSMEGTSIAQAKQALLMALDRLTPDDAFNIVQFNSVTDVLFNSSVTASAANIAKARDYVKALRATGGTEMAPALTAALNNSDNQRVLRQVIFLTDGAVGNEAQLFELIKARLGDSRLFTVGIGSAPNTYFMSKAAQLGRGTYTYIGKVDEVKEKMTRLFTKLESPVVSNLRVTWPADAEAEMWPRQIPDLYLGEPLFVTAKLRKLAGTVLLEGQIGAETWRAEVSTQLASAESGINVLWARDEIESLSDAMRGSKGEDNKQAITDLALHHHLVSKYTSMVAVDVTKTLPNDALTQTSAMPTNLPEGWNYEAVFGTLPQTATSAREQLLLGLLLLAIATLWLLRRPART